MIRAECHTSNLVFAIKFDAEPYFEQIPEKRLIALAARDFRGDGPADDVAGMIADLPGYEDIHAMLSYLRREPQRSRAITFECCVHGPDVIRYLRACRPDSLTALQAAVPEAFSTRVPEEFTPHWEQMAEWSGNYLRLKGDFPGTGFLRDTLWIAA